MVVAELSDFALVTANEKKHTNQPLSKAGNLLE